MLPENLERKVAPFLNKTLIPLISKVKIAILEIYWGISSYISDKHSRKHGFIVPTLCARRANSSNANRRLSCHILDAHDTQNGLVGSTSSLRLSISSSQAAQ